MANKVKISDAIDSTSSVIAASLKAVKQAYDKAVSAQNTANSANSTANSAKTAASNAQSTANTANNTANTANSTANSAKTAASNAQNTANTALSTAQNAQNAANGRAVLAGVVDGTLYGGMYSTNNSNIIRVYLPNYGTWGLLEVNSNDNDILTSSKATKYSGGTMISENNGLLYRKYIHFVRIA